MKNSENEIGLKKIIDMTRMMSITILLLHIYVVCYAAFKERGWTHHVSDKLLINIGRTGLFDTFHRGKLIALAFLTISLIGAKGKKGDTFNYRTAIAYALSGILIYFTSYLSLQLTFENMQVKAVAYIVLTIVGFIFYLTGGSILSRIIKSNLSGDVFNTLNETFPQEERLLENKYSVNFRTRYQLKNKTRHGYVNVINGFRGTLLMGLSGSGKTRFVVRE